MKRSHPSLWRGATLGQVCDLIGGGTPARENKKYFEGSIPWATPTDVTALDELYISRTDEYITEDALAESSAKLLPIGAVLMTSRATIGEAVVAAVPMATNQGFANFVCDEQVLDSEYLACWLRAHKEFLISRAGGTTFKEISKSTLSKIKISLPPLPEQQRIVEILKQADTLCRQRREILDQTKQLPAALFLEMFGDPRDYPKKWGTKPFGHFVTYSKYGPRFPDREYSEVGARILRTTDMEGDGSLRWWDSPVMRVTQEELKHHALKPGTLLVSRSGTIGPVALFLQADEPCIAGAYLIEFGLSSAINHRFVTDLLLSGYGQAVLTSGSQSMTQANLNAPAIKKIAVPTPPRDLQDKYEAMSLAIREFLSVEEAEAGGLEALRSELVRSTFAGEVTQQWREAHRAELEKWLSENAAHLPKKTTRISFTEIAPPERAPASSSHRYEVLNQLGDLQRFIRDALREWKGTLIPAEHLKEFMAQWPVEHLEDVHDQALRALDQLAGLGLIARVSIQNQQGEYVTGYRMLRDDELTKLSDLQRLGTPA